MTKEEQKANDAPQDKKNTEADNYFESNKQEAKSDFDKACDLYRNYVGKSETIEERMRRIRNFRCG